MFMWYWHYISKLYSVHVCSMQVCHFFYSQIIIQYWMIKMLKVMQSIKMDTKLDICQSILVFTECSRGLHLPNRRGLSCVRSYKPSPSIAWPRSLTVNSCCWPMLLLPSAKCCDRVRPESGSVSDCSSPEPSDGVQRLSDCLGDPRALKSHPPMRFALTAIYCTNIFFGSWLACTPDTCCLHYWTAQTHILLKSSQNVWGNRFCVTSSLIGR